MNRISQHRPARSGFTVPELQVAVAVSAVVAGGILAIYLFGAKIQLFVQAKLNAADKSRQAVSLFTRDVREAAGFDIGTGSASNFTAVAAGQPRQGNAIQIYSSTNAATFVRYFVDATDQSLKRMPNDAAQARVIAESVTNLLVFTAEDAFGNVTTNQPHIEVAGMQLMFNQTLLPRRSGGDFTELNQVSIKANKRVSLGYQN